MTARGMLEKELQAAVVDLAEMMGLRTYHTYDSRRSNPGFPDLVIVGRRVVYLELKSARGRLSPAQHEWITALKAAGQEVHVIYPADWPDAVVRIFRAAR